MKIFSFNLHKGFGPFKLSFSLPNLKILFQGLDADFIFLQEVHGLNSKIHNQMQDWPDSSQYEYLADQIWTEYAYAKNAVYNHGHHGNAILSKFPIVFEHKLDLSLHSLEKRSLLHCVVELPESGKRIHLLNLHLNLRHSDRVKQWELIHQYISRNILDNEFVLLAGDFNDWHTRLHPVIERTARLKEVSNILHGQFTSTFPSFFPRLPLDRIYYRNLEPLKFYRMETREWSRLSDHLPVLAEFEE